MVQQQASITMSGYVGSEPVNFHREGSIEACSLRLGSTPAYYRSDERQWKERPTTWLTVKAYRNLATNVMKSVHKGDAIVVYGTLNTESWKKDGNDYSRVVLEASAIGHDLNRGTSQFTKRTLKHQDDAQAHTHVSLSHEHANHQQDSVHDEF